MLAVPASALAFTGVATQSAPSLQNPVQTPLNLQLSSRRVTLRQRGDDHRDRAGDRRRQAASWSRPPPRASRPGARWARRRSSAAGTFRARVAPRRSGCCARSSRSRPQRPPLTARPRRAAPRAPRRALGRRSPWRPGSHRRATPRRVIEHRPVHVERQAAAGAGRPARCASRAGGHGWHTLSTGRTGARGGYRLRVAPGAGRRTPLRVVFAGDRRNGRATRAGRPPHRAAPGAGLLV